MRCSDVNGVSVWKAVHLQDGRVGAALAGLAVANHPFNGERFIVEGKAALLWAGTTQTYKQTSVSDQLRLEQSTPRIT